MRDRRRQTLEFVVPPPVNARVRVGVDENGRRRNRLEIRGRQWAADHQVRVPDVIAHDPAGAWLVSENLPSGPARGRDFVQAGLEMANTIAAAPPLLQSDAPTSWRSPSWAVGHRAYKIWRAGITPQQFIHTRNAASALPAETTMHGDLHDGNVLFSGDRPAAVIDWEYVGTGPRHADAIRFLTTLESDDDAEYALELVLRGATSDSWHAIGTQLRWLALRHLADHLTADVPISRSRLADVRRRWVLADDWARQVRARGA